MPVPATFEYNNLTFQGYVLPDSVVKLAYSVNMADSDSLPGSAPPYAKEVLEDAMLISRSMFENREFLTRLA